MGFSGRLQPVSWVHQDSAQPRNHAKGRTLPPPHPTKKPFPNRHWNLFSPEFKHYFLQNASRDLPNKIRYAIIGRCIFPSPCWPHHKITHLFRLVCLIVPVLPTQWEAPRMQDLPGFLPVSPGPSTACTQTPLRREVPGSSRGLVGFKEPVQTLYWAGARYYYQILADQSTANLNASSQTAG